jgi:hypothetical protein
VGRNRDGWRATRWEVAAWGEEGDYVKICFIGVSVGTSVWGREEGKK